MDQHLLPGTQIEVIREVDRGRFRHALFDFDGTASLLREGWQRIMAPVMLEMICGDTEPDEALREEVDEFIADTTGVQTIVQMEQLVDLIRKHGRVPEKDIKDAFHYKQVYNDRLMVPVNERLARLERGEKQPRDFMLRGARGFIEALSERGLTLYIFSGTDRHDVVNEAEKLGLAHYFDGGIWGAIGRIEDYSKEKVLRELIAQNDLHGSEVLVVGDGPVEIRNGNEAGCVTIGVASDEVAGHGWNHWKRERLIRAGADIMVPDFGDGDALVAYLFDEPA